MINTQPTIEITFDNAGSEPLFIHCGNDYPVTDVMITHWEEFVELTRTFISDKLGTNITIQKVMLCHLTQQVYPSQN